ncbi:MAG: hypothetical protein AB1546_11005 [bacterium]
MFLFAFLLSLPACSSKKTTYEGSRAKKQAADYVLMEKVLADQPNRPRTTMKILMPDAGNDGDTLKAALADVRKQDKSLKAVIIWAYRTREELNGPNYTAGKLEWSSDGKNFAGQNELSPNPKIDIIQKQ